MITTSPSLACQSCAAPLTGGRDTFGEVGQALCGVCWFAEQHRIAMTTTICNGCGKRVDDAVMTTTGLDEYICPTCVRADNLGAARGTARGQAERELLRSVIALQDQAEFARVTEQST